MLNNLEDEKKSFLIKLHLIKMNSKLMYFVEHVRASKLSIDMVTYSRLDFSQQASNIFSALLKKKKIINIIIELQVCS